MPNQFDGIAELPKQGSHLIDTPVHVDDDVEGPIVATCEIPRYSRLRQSGKPRPMQISSSRSLPPFGDPIDGPAFQMHAEAIGELLLQMSRQGERQVTRAKLCTERLPAREGLD